jgi:hypothetical protein
MTATGHAAGVAGQNDTTERGDTPTPAASGRPQAGRGGYVGREAAVAAVFSAVVSVAVAALTLGRNGEVPLHGVPEGLTFDAAPQTFFVVLMSCLAPLALARRRGLLRPAAARPLTWIMVPVCALALGGLAYGAHALLLPSSGSWPMGSVLLYKAVYGAVVGALVACAVLNVTLTRPWPAPRAA